MRLDAVVGDDVNVFARCQGARHLNPRAVQLISEVQAVLVLMRPLEPCAFVGFFFGWEGVFHFGVGVWDERVAGTAEKGDGEKDVEKVFHLLIGT